MAHLSEEHKKKISEAVKKHLPSTAYKKGSKLTLEQRQKISNALIGNKYNLGNKASPETRRKRSEQTRGAKHWNWRGGVNPINDTIRKSLEYKLWRESVFERDNYTCVWCGDHNYDGRGKTVKLNADHIKPFAFFPELRFAIDNGRTLCVPCHRKTDTYSGRGRKK